MRVRPLSMTEKGKIMVDRIPDGLHVQFDEYFQDGYTESTLTAHEKMIELRGSPMWPPVDGCPDCGGKGKIIENGNMRYCTCMYKERES